MKGAVEEKLTFEAAYARCVRCPDFRGGGFCGWMPPTPAIPHRVCEPIDTIIECPAGREIESNKEAVYGS
ncbi:MAG TPA: hypothetical protein VFI02_12005 [Armatimonadota bacterium]|nr:hypothetical protein [Armatimonadota bacterium]